MDRTRLKTRDLNDDEAGLPLEGSAAAVSLEEGGVSVPDAVTYDVDLRSPPAPASGGDDVGGGDDDDPAPLLPVNSFKEVAAAGRVVRSHSLTYMKVWLKCTLARCSWWEKADEDIPHQVDVHM